MSRWVRQAQVDVVQDKSSELTTEIRSELAHLHCEVRTLNQEPEILENPKPSSRRRCCDPTSVSTTSATPSAPTASVSNCEWLEATIRQLGTGTADDSDVVSLLLMDYDGSSSGER